MADIISLLSDEEDVPIVEPAKKKRKLTIQSKRVKARIASSLTVIDSIALSDDDDEDKVISKENTPPISLQVELQDRNKCNDNLPSNCDNVSEKEEKVAEVIESDIVKDDSDCSEDLLKICAITDVRTVTEPVFNTSNGQDAATENCEVDEVIQTDTKDPPSPDSSNEHGANEEDCIVAEASHNSSNRQENGEARTEKLTSDQAYNLFYDFETFSNKCAEFLENSKFKKVYMKQRIKLEKLYRALFKKDQLDNFESILKPELEKLLDSESAFIIFTRIYVYLRDRYKNSNVNEDVLSKIDNLEKVSRKLYKRIKQLEETPVDFDEENDSAYIQLQKYKDKYVKVDEKLCELYDIDKKNNRVMFMPLSFCDSNYPLINKAIKIKYDKAIDSPDFCQFNKYIRKYLKSKSFSISENELVTELKFCFERLCKLMKERRKKDLLDIHKDYLIKASDAPSSDPELNIKLENNKREGQARMEEVFRKYTVLQDQDLNKAVAVSSDSDDSHLEESDAEGEEKTDT